MAFPPTAPWCFHQVAGAVRCCCIPSKDRSASGHGGLRLLKLMVVGLGGGWDHCVFRIGWGALPQRGVQIKLVAFYG